MGTIKDTRLSKVSASISTTSPSQRLKNDLQYKINSDWDYAPDVYAIEEELTSGTLVWSDVEVRITHAMDSPTGTKLGEDWRNLIFKDSSYLYGLGHRYRFDNYIWLTINTDYYKYSTFSSTIRRCNYTLKWYNEVGKLIEEPCIVEYFKFASKDNVEETKYLRVGDGIRYVFLQNNSETSKLKRDKRFIVDGRAFKIAEYDSITKAGLFTLTLEEHQINEINDDLVNGIADAFNKETYTVDILNSNISFSVGNTVQLQYTVKSDGVLVTGQDISFSSNNESIATVNANGLITAVANGTCNITAYLSNNSSIGDSINIEVTSTPSTETREVIDGSSSIPIGLTSDYIIYKYINGVAQADTYTFTVIGTGATIVTSTGNLVTLRAGKTKSVSIVLQAKNNITDDIITKNISITSLW